MRGGEIPLEGRRLGGPLPADPGRRMVEPDPVAEPYEQRAMGVGLDFLRRRLLLARRRAEEARERVEIASTDCNGAAGDDDRRSTDDGGATHVELTASES